MRCPLNNFVPCGGGECEWYIERDGACAITLLARSSKNLDEINLHLNSLKEDGRNQPTGTLR